jgi:hypothetical protein
MLTSSGAGSGTSTQVKPCSTMRQLAAQPSPPTVLPSSQASGAQRRPSPHTATHTPSVQSGSRLQNGSQPSPTARLPSSHSSVPSTSVSPQSVATQAAPGVGHA